MAEILPIWRKTLSNQSINLRINLRMDRCQGFCVCDKNSCDALIGCTPITTSIQITFLPLQTTK